MNKTQAKACADALRKVLDGLRGAPEHAISRGREHKREGDLTGTEYAFAFGSLEQSVKNACTDLESIISSRLARKSS